MAVDTERLYIGDLVFVGNPSTALAPGTTFSAFTNAAGTATDPTAVVLEIRRPDGTETAYSWPTGSPALLKESAGRFYVGVSLTQGGIWYWRLAGTGAVEKADEGIFEVERSVFVP